MFLILNKPVCKRKYYYLNWQICVLLDFSPTVSRHGLEFTSQLISVTFEGNMEGLTFTVMSTTILPIKMARETMSKIFVKLSFSLAVICNILLR